MKCTEPNADILLNVNMSVILLYDFCPKVVRSGPICNQQDMLVLRHKRRQTLPDLTQWFMVRKREATVELSVGYMWSTVCVRARACACVRVCPAPLPVLPPSSILPQSSVQCALFPIRKNSARVSRMLLLRVCFVLF